MPRVSFTPNLERHLSCPEVEVSGGTVREILDGVFRDNQRLGGYVLDEQGRLRQHMTVFVQGRAVQDRSGLSDPVGSDDEVWVYQMLSGG